MKKAGIITFLHNDNFGSTLQAWALQEALTSLGWEAFHLNYAPDTKEKIRNLLTSRNSPALLLDGIKKRSVKAGQAAAREKSAGLRAFQQEYLHLSAPCRNSSQLANAAREADVLIAGSDQIWSPTWFNPVYFLSFAQEQRKVAYAPSLGVSQLKNSRKKQLFRQLTAGFQAVSVREEEGAALLKDITGQAPAVLPDPVFLISRKRWLCLAAPMPERKPYLLCYFLGNRPEYWDTARKLADEQQLELLVIPVTEEAYSCGLPLTHAPDPRQWLGLIAQADMVMTDSFHGAAFTALLGRRLKLLRRYADTSALSRNSRIDQLARNLHLQENDMPSDTVLQANLQRLQQEGLSWLQAALET